jgi:large subunit ribosomal protein L18
VKREKRINRQRRRRCLRVRNAVKRNSTRPRLSVFRSLKHIYAQIIDDDQGKTLVAVSTLDTDLRGQIAYGGNCEAARVVGKTIAERAVQADIKQVAFDRREYKYHGRVAALADAARDVGLDLGPKKEVPQKEEPKAEKKKTKSKKSK